MRERHCCTITAHSRFYCLCASFTNAQLPLLKVAALCFEQLIILDSVSTGLAIIGKDHHARMPLSL